ncbi:MAG: hypothetical protein AAF802_00345 [Planctomycetota bacterium]
MTTVSKHITLSLALMTLTFAGCSGKVSDDSQSVERSNAVDSRDAHAGHGHPSEGPHHGDLIELGNEEYHAEILHDEDAGTVTIYVLNGAATVQVPIDATEVTINAKHDGKPEQFTLAASPEANDPQGKSSRFVSNDEVLAHHLDEEGAEPRLVLTINGKSYRGTISHDHDHEGHDH